jgi:two-component system nitrate/nitrite sensor histidine kinase NarX
MIKEALNNVVKHAAASSVRISLQADPDYLSLMIEDDGQGFEVQEYKQRGQDRFGLFIMQERAGESALKLKLNPIETTEPASSFGSCPSSGGNQT